jgi:hypothetical protein
LRIRDVNSRVAPAQGRDDGQADRISHRSIPATRLAALSGGRIAVRQNAIFRNWFKPVGFVSAGIASVFQKII